MWAGIAISKLGVETWRGQRRFQYHMQLQLEISLAWWVPIFRSFESL